MVPSPEPLRIVELEAISTLIAADMIVVCVGGGGVPVIVDGHGRLRGVEAVIDKDLAATLLARQLGADALLLLTDVPAIQADWGRPMERPIATIAVSELAKLELAGGSMGPKAKAASRFVTDTGGLAVIGALADAGSMLSGATGTRVVADIPEGGR